MAINLATEFQLPQKASQFESVNLKENLLTSRFSISFIRTNDLKQETRKCLQNQSLYS